MERSTVPPDDAKPERLPALVRSLDWSRTSLGRPSDWPAALKSTLSLCLDSAFPIAIYWGPELVLLYNDAWRPILGDKHPWALGRAGREVWPEIWDAIEPVFSKVMREGVGVFHHDSLLGMHRHGYVEECYFDYTFNPIRDADGKIEGILNVVTETTYRVINERRSRVQRDFAARIGGARTTDEVIALATHELAGAAHDVPFAAFYRLAPPTGTPALLGAFGDAAGHAANWPLQAAASQRRALPVADVSRLVPLASAVWPEPIREAIVIPISTPGRADPDLFLVLGASPRRGLDAEYIAFFESLAGHVDKALAQAEAFETQRQRAESLAELDRAKTAFFSNVSHELRTPLTLMLGPVQELLDTPGAIPEASRDTLAVVQRNGQRMLKLVNSLLDFSRVEAGRVEARYEPVDLGAFTAELGSVFRSAIEGAGLTLTVDCGASRVTAFVDRDMWEKIVLNLISNAFKYTLQGGIRVALAADGGRVQLSVEDTGIGIPPHELPKVFDRFHRVEGARGRTQEGSGIGLALVHELVKLHGGTVEVDSAEGRGSRFTVRLPLGKEHLPPERVRVERSQPPAARSASTFVDEAMGWLPRQPAAEEVAPDVAPAAHAASAVPRARIVLADDNADMRDYLVRLLSAHDVVAVADGALALAAVAQQVPDLVLTDAMMPNLDGFGLIKALRENPLTAAVPIIMLSARAGEEARVAGRKSGADDYLVKPFSARELQARVEAQLTLRRVRHEALQRERQLRIEAETLHSVAAELAGDLDLQRLVQRVTDAATALTGAEFGAFFYNVTNDKGQSYQLFTLSGAPREAFEKFGMPRNTPIFAPTFAGDAPVRLDDVTKDRRYGAMSPHHGQPRGHLPVVSYLAVPVKTRAGEVLGGLFFGHPLPGVFTERSERLAVGVAALAAVAMDNAKLYQAARDAERRKDEFLATLAHELRNPLAPLRNGVAALKQIATDAEAAGPVLQMMERQLTHIVRLIDDLLDLSRISLGKVALQKEPVELIKALQSAVEASRPMVEARNHRLSISVPPQDCWIDADATRLAQVFGNLLNNAAKFTPPGGHIGVHVLRSGREVDVAVTDSGIGIPAEMLERIFDMFSQLEDPMEKTQPGLGIGLTLVRQLVELHGGRVHAESAGSGTGATLRVTLPLREGAPAPSSDPQSRAHRTAPLRVLIADDNVDAALTLETILGLYGHEVRTVHDGAAAIREAAAFRPQLVLLDIGMPGMNGFDVCRRIRAEQRPDVAMMIAALTGWAQEDHKARARDSGFDRHLVKPAELAQIEGLLAEAASRVRA